MEIVIVRHAIAADRDPHRWPGDRDRPLTGPGIRRFRRVARHLAQIVPDVERVWSSPFARAWQTAQILRAEADWPAPEPLVELEPEAEVRGVLTRLREAGTLARVALVGHEPRLSELVSVLLSGSVKGVVVEVKKGGAVLLACDGEVRPGAARLLWLLPPRAVPGVED